MSWSWIWASTLSPSENLFVITVSIKLILKISCCLEYYSHFFNVTKVTLSNDDNSHWLPRTPLLFTAVKDLLQIGLGSTSQFPSSHMASCIQLFHASDVGTIVGSYYPRVKKLPTILYMKNYYVDRLAFLGTKKGHGHFHTRYMYSVVRSA